MNHLVCNAGMMRQPEREAELCHRNTEQLKALQAAERERQRVMEAAN